MNTRQSIVTTLSALAILIPAASQARIPGRHMPRSSESKVLAEFKTGIDLSDVHHFNNFEIQLATMARDRTTRPEVKTFSDMIITDHQKSDADLQTLAAKENIKLADFIASENEQATLQQLKVLAPEDFDNVYLSFQAMLHRDVASKLSRHMMIQRNNDVGDMLRANYKTTMQHAGETSKLQRQVAAGK